MRLDLRPQVLVIGLLIGVGVRLAVLAFVDFRFDVGDAKSYRLVAHNLVQHGIYSDEPLDSPKPNAYRPPLYSATLAAIALVAGESTRAAQLFQILLSLATGLLVTAVAARHTPAAAPWAFFGMMLSPFDAVYTGALLSETLATFLLVSTAASLLLLVEWKRWVASGVAAGLLVLCRDIYLPLVLLFAVLWMWRGAGVVRRRFTEAVVLVGVTALVVLPWTIRNTVLLGSLVPVSSGRLGISLWLGSWAINADFTKNNGLARLVYPPEATRDDEERRMLAEATAQETDPERSDATFRRLAFARLREEPLSVLGRCFRRWPRLWLGTRYDIFTLNARLLPPGTLLWTAVKSSLWALNFGMLALGAFGGLLAFRRRSAIAWVLVPIAFTGAVYFPLNSYENRYSQPVLAFVVLFASLAAAELAARVRNLGPTARRERSDQISRG